MNPNAMTIYQIYPKSFYDSNGDGIGDLEGIRQKLDYLQDLGVDMLWLTPFYPSPQRDNGYDISDYCAVDPRFGSMQDVERLIKEAKQRNIGLMFDMVFNHTSTEHPWFQRALQGDPYYQEFYLFRPGKGEGEPPNNWQSKFGGGAWEYVPHLNLWYLHLFDRTQADLNWENDAVRAELKKILRFWIDKGVQGFRFDVINLVDKSSFEDDGNGDGRSFYTDGKRVNTYLQELKEETFGREDGFITVGEMSSTSIDACAKYAHQDDGALDMVFSFHHLKVDFMGHEKWVLRPYDFLELKKILFEWQVQMQERKARMALFWCNHDQPRVVSRFGEDQRYRATSAKMLAMVLHGLMGTPYIYQGEEIGMGNPHYTSIDLYRDVESCNAYQMLRERGISEFGALAILDAHSRDNSRTPMQWNSGEHAGFSVAEPWIPLPAERPTNVQEQLGEANSIFACYKTLIQMRKENHLLQEGKVVPLFEDHPLLFVYARELEQVRILVVANFYETEVSLPRSLSMEGEWMYGNYPQVANHAPLRPYEARYIYQG